MFGFRKSDKRLFEEGAGRLVQYHLRADPNRQQEIKHTVKSGTVRGVPVGDWEIITRPIKIEAEQ